MRCSTSTRPSTSPISSQAPFDATDCAELGIEPVEPALEIAAAAARRRAGLSFHDHLGLLLARENGWTCVTDDGCLQRACRSENLPVVWSHELIALLVDGHVLQALEAEELGRAMRLESAWNA